MCVYILPVLPSYALAYLALCTHSIAAFCLNPVIFWDLAPPFYFYLILCLSCWYLKEYLILCLPSIHSSLFHTSPFASLWQCSAAIHIQHHVLPRYFQSFSSTSLGIIHRSSHNNGAAKTISLTLANSAKTTGLQKKNNIPESSNLEDARLLDHCSSRGSVCGIGAGYAKTRCRFLQCAHKDA